MTDREDLLADVVRSIVAAKAPRDELSYEDINPDFWAKEEGES